MSHTCHAIGCKDYCKPTFLMCKKHWDMVPKSKQQRVYAEYRPGQCNLDPIPSPQWHDAADVAIYCVHIQELRKVIAAIRLKLEINDG